MAWSFSQNPLKKTHVRFSISSSAAVVNMSDIKAEISVTPKQGHRAGLLENTVNEEDNWTKVVLSVQ